MKYIFLLRNTKTGETKEYRDDYNWDTFEGMRFQWFEGNFSCDCNRSIFLYDRDEDKELCCSGLDDNVIVIDEITEWE